LKLSEMVNTAVPTRMIRCDDCLQTHSPTDDSHTLMGVIPGFQFCPCKGKFATWTQLAIPSNFIIIPNLGGE